MICILLQINFMKKNCTICNSEFETIKFGGKREYCFDCLPSEGLSAPERKTLIRQVLKKKTIEYKGGKCSKCGYDKCIAALQLHHTDPSQKEFSLSSYQSTKWSDYKKEADKCELLCANCHAELHWRK
jgi:hypothetical protein